jgi:hypothetical protein
MFPIHSCPICQTRSLCWQSEFPDRHSKAAYLSMPRHFPPVSAIGTSLRIPLLEMPAASLWLPTCHIRAPRPTQPPNSPIPILVIFRAGRTR